MMIFARLFCLGWLLVAPFPSNLAAADLKPVVVSWLAARSQVQTWSAEFVQTRTLKSLTQPLTAPGHVWFMAPNRFRWELGMPAQSIAIRTTSDLMIVYPKLKRLERFTLSAQQTGPWRDALALLEAGFPRNQADLEAQYLVLSQTETSSFCELVLEPKSQSARRMIPQILIQFDSQSLALLATQLQFADGSTLRNDFKNPVLNPNVDPQLFEPVVPADYKVVEPTKK